MHRLVRGRLLLSLTRTRERDRPHRRVRARELLSGDASAKDRASDLRLLVERRNDLLRIRTAEKNRPKSPGPLRKPIRRHIDWLDQEVALPEEQIQTRSRPMRRWPIIPGECRRRVLSDLDAQRREYSRFEGPLGAPLEKLS